MIILGATDDYPFFHISTPWGYEQLISYENKFYVCLEKYDSLENAIADCQIDLEVGFNSIVLEERTGASLWCCLPENAQTSLANHPSYLTQNSASDRAVFLSSKAPSDRSWFSLSSHISQACKAFVSPCH